MGLLLYKSDEMYSSTELIRKSKMIFDKILDKKIDKAIILRDGKPCFLLMEFKKYEKIMAEYEELKDYIESIKEHKSTQKLKKIKKYKVLEEVIPEIIEIAKEPIQEIAVQDKTKIEKLQTPTPISDIVTQDISEEQEINDAMQSIEIMNFSDDMKKEAEEKIKIRILQARQEREEILADEKQNKEDLKEELILQNQLKKEKVKKDRELQEFWD